MAKRKRVIKDEVIDIKDEVITQPRQIRFENRIPKKNIFLADHYRDEKDEQVFNNQIRNIGQQNYKKNVLCVTTIKHMVVDKQGDWVTEFIIEMKG